MATERWHYFWKHFWEGLNKRHYLPWFAAMLPNTEFANIYIRPRLWRWAGISVGYGTYIAMGTTVTPGHFSIGEDSRVNTNCRFDCVGGITIGNHCQIAGMIAFETMGHPVEPVLNNVRRALPAPIILEDYVWVASGAVILPGVTIGRGSVVAAGAVVAKDVPPFTVVGGVPAKPVRKIDKTV